MASIFYLILPLLGILVILFSLVFYARRKRLVEELPAEQETRTPATPTPSGLASRVKAINFDSAISTILIVMAIIVVVGLILFAISIVKSGSAENFSDDDTFKDYHYQGRYLVDEEVLKICGKASIINEDAGYKFLGIWYFPAENSEFGFMTGGKGTINITMKSGYDNFTFQLINVSETTKVSFGTSLVPGKKGKIWMDAGKKNLSPSDAYFNTGGKYSVIIEINGSVWIDDLYIGG